MEAEAGRGRSSAAPVARQRARCRHLEGPHVDVATPGGRGERTIRAPTGRACQFGDPFCAVPSQGRWCVTAHHSRITAHAGAVGRATEGRGSRAYPSDRIVTLISTTTIAGGHVTIRPSRAELAISRLLRSSVEGGRVHGMGIMSRHAGGSAGSRRTTNGTSSRCRPE